MLKNISVTNHAVDRYAERCLECGIPAQFYEMIRDELANEVDLSSYPILGDGRYPLRSYPDHCAVVSNSSIVTVRNKK